MSEADEVEIISVDTDALRAKLNLLNAGAPSYVEAMRLDAELLQELPAVLRTLDDARHDVRRAQKDLYRLKGASDIEKQAAFTREARLQEEVTRLNTEVNKAQQTVEFAAGERGQKELAELRALLAATQRSFTAELERRTQAERAVTTKEHEMAELRQRLATTQQSLNAANDSIQRNAITIYNLRGDLATETDHRRRAEAKVTSLELDATLHKASSKVTTPDFLTRFRMLNVERSAESFHHRLHDWSEMEWGAATAGELGELLNVLKKRRRGDADAPSIADCAREAADTICYLDLLLARMRVDMARAVTLKFNEVSRRVGSTLLLDHASIELCPECGRPKARHIDDAIAGCCPKWWAVHDPEAKRDCEKHMTPPRAKDLPDLPGLTSQPAATKP